MKKLLLSGMLLLASLVGFSQTTQKFKGPIEYAPGIYQTEIVSEEQYTYNVKFNEIFNQEEVDDKLQESYFKFKEYELNVEVDKINHELDIIIAHYTDREKANMLFEGLKLLK